LLRYAFTALLGCAFQPAAAQVSAQAAGPASAPASSTSSQAAELALQKARVVVASPLGACFRAPPEYPKSALRKDESGTSVVLLVIKETGEIESPGLLKSSGHASLDWAAFNHLKSCISKHPQDPEQKLPPGRYALPLTWRIE
jgi:protein TonB